MQKYKKSIAKPEKICNNISSKGETPFWLCRDYLRHLNFFERMKDHEKISIRVPIVCHGALDAVDPRSGRDRHLRCKRNGTSDFSDRRQLGIAHL